MILFFVGLGCINDIDRYRRVDIEGSIVSDNMESPVYLSAHHAWFGEGVLRYPAAEFDSIVLSKPESFLWTIDVPISEDASGVLIYGWQDLDGDGVFCSLEGEEEYSDLIEIEEYPIFKAVITMHLNRPCEPPELLWDTNGLVE